MHLVFLKLVRTEDFPAGIYFSLTFLSRTRFCLSLYSLLCKFDTLRLLWIGLETSRTNFKKWPEFDIVRKKKMGQF
jgi:hypothetical protein